MELVGFSVLAILVLENLKKKDILKIRAGEPFIHPSDPYNPSADFKASYPDIYLPTVYVGTTENDKYNIQGLNTQTYYDKSEYRYRKLKKKSPLERKRYLNKLFSQINEDENPIIEDIRQRNIQDEAVKVTERLKSKEYKKFRIKK